MKNFMAVYTGSETNHQAWTELSEEARNARVAEGMKAWQDWGAKYADRIVYQGGPLGKTKRIGKDGVSDIKNNLAAFNVVRAESHEEAARMFEDHPHFTLFPGESVEVMPELPIPGA